MMECINRCNMKVWSSRFLFHVCLLLHTTSCSIAFNNNFQTLRCVSNDCTNITSGQTSSILFFSDEDIVASTSSQKSTSIDKDLMRPPINIRKESLLFSENPATAKNNNFSRLWKLSKQRLPYVLTGVSSCDENYNSVDDNPIGALYNMIIVRFPTLVAGLFYTKNLVEGHPLFCDFGYGLIEVPPLLVYGVILVILR